MQQQTNGSLGLFSELFDACKMMIELVSEAGTTSTVLHIKMKSSLSSLGVSHELGKEGGWYKYLN